MYTMAETVGGQGGHFKDNYQKHHAVSLYGLNSLCSWSLLHIDDIYTLLNFLKLILFFTKLHK